MYSGIATLKDLDIIKDSNIKFIRIGTNVDRFRDMEPFIKKSKKLGLFVCANFMKSYLMKPKDFAKLAKWSKSVGTDLIYLVDSAGGMFPDDIKNYHYEIMSASNNVKIGFHGHDNLGQGIANALMAFDLKFDMIDASPSRIRPKLWKYNSRGIPLCFEKEKNSDGYRLY